MIKKIFLILLVFIALPACAQDKVIVESLNDFSTKNPDTFINARVINKIEFDNGIVFEKNARIQGRVIEIVEAKRLKRDAYFIIKPIAYKNPDGIEKEIDQTNWEAKVTGFKPFNIKNAAETAGVGIANYFMQGASTVYHFGKGFIRPKDGEGRIKGGAKEVCDSSFLSYIKQGNPLIVQKGDLLELVFYRANVPAWKIWEK